MPKFSLGKLAIWFTATIVLAAVAAPWVRYGFHLQRGGIAPSLNVVFIAGGWVEGHGDIHLVDLHGIPVTSEILRAVREIDPASRIDLSNTSLDADMLYLLHHLRSKEIDLSGNQIDENSIENLRKHLDPTCNLIYDAAGGPK